MEKKKQTLVVATVVATLAVATTLVVANNHNLVAFAGIQENEYGCAANCTGEYYPSHLSALVKADKSLDGIENVRVIAKVSAMTGWFQDIDYMNPVKNITSSLINSGKILTIAAGSSYGYSMKKFKEGDIVGFYGQIIYKTTGYPAPMIEIKNPTFYKWNDQINYELLKPVVYIN
jgi:hypothetical protein